MALRGKKLAEEVVQMMRAVRMPWRVLVLLVLAYLSALGIALAQARAYSVSDVPNVHLVDARRYTSDPEGFVRPHERVGIDSIAQRVEQERGVQIAIVLLPSIGEQDVESFANELFRSWGIGGKESNRGLLILYVGDQRRVRSEVGYGLEGELTDAFLGRVQRERMIPHFREGKTGEGLLSALLAIEEQLAREGLEPSADAPEEEGSLWGAILFCWALVAGATLWGAYSPLNQKIRRAQSPEGARSLSPKLEQDASTLLILTALLCLPLLPFVYIWWRRRKRTLVALASRCPVCGQNHMHRRPLSRETLHLLSHAQQVEARLGSRAYYIYVCTSCGASECSFAPGPQASRYTECPVCQAHAVSTERVGRITPQTVRYRRRCHSCGWSEDQDRHERDTSDDLATAFVLGSLLRGGGRGGGFSSGGGFSGGSWGGGSSGGGGVTSGW